jgi:hypothetical protein
MTEFEESKMRLVAIIILASMYSCNPAGAEPTAQSGEIHCEPEKAAQNQDFAKLEAKCLAQMNGLASRNGDELRLVLASGKIKSLLSNHRACDDNDADKCLMYRLSAYYPAQQLFVIEADQYESYSVAAVSASTGATTLMDDHPHLSPGGKRLAVAFSSEAWETKRDIAIYTVENGMLRLEWSYKAKDYEQWEFAGWDGDDHVKLRVTSRLTDSAGKEDLATRDADVRRTDAGWRLRKPTNAKPKRGA